MVEAIAEHSVVRGDEGRESAEVELKGAGEEDGVFAVYELGEATLEVMVLGELSADEARGACAERGAREFA